MSTKTRMFIGAGLCWLVLVIFNVLGYIYLATHHPETFDLGYCGMAGVCTFMTFSIIRSIKPTISILNEMSE